MQSVQLYDNLSKIAANDFRMVHSKLEVITAL